MINGHLPHARTAAARELEQVQKQIVRGQLAATRRQELILQFHAKGMSQVEIAERLTRASLAAGGDAVGVDTVQHIYARNRHKLRRQ